MSHVCAGAAESLKLRGLPPWNVVATGECLPRRWKTADTAAAARDTSAKSCRSHLFLGAEVGPDAT
eukprot:2807363-Pyramimonas_sp.AAC.1